MLFHRSLCYDEDEDDEDEERVVSLLICSSRLEWRKVAADEGEKGKMMKESTTKMVSSEVESI